MLELVKKMDWVQELRGFLGRRIVQLAALAASLACLGWLTIERKWATLDLDIWWHLKVGDWIVAHAAVPHNGVFSWTAATRPWVAYSWGYEVMLSRAFAWGGLPGIAWFGEFLTFLVAYGIYWMLRRLSGSFWVSLPLAVAANFAFLFNLAPRPVFFSMFLFTVLFTLLLEAQRSAQVQPLYWLPLVFLVWANLHIQFIYGIAVVALFAGVHLLQRVLSVRGFAPPWLAPPRLPAGRVAVIAAACFIATLVNPYGFHLYAVILEYSKATLTYSIIAELQPLSFTALAHYVQLLLAGAAFFVVGWRKRLDPFQLLLLSLASVVAFRTMRDSWFLCIPAAACLAASRPEDAARQPSETPLENVGLAVVVILLLALIARDRGFARRDLDRAITASFPVYAANFLHRNPMPGPLYNTFDWGGFLIWYLPQYPVAIDGRNDLYGDELDLRFYKSEMGDPSYLYDPYLNAAAVLLLQKEKPLAQALMHDSRFRVVYSDQMAVVLVRNAESAAVLPAQPY